jgi:hypothetical protein
MTTACIVVQAQGVHGFGSAGSYTTLRALGVEDGDELIYGAIDLAWSEDQIEGAT